MARDFDSNSTFFIKLKSLFLVLLLSIPSFTYAQNAPSEAPIKVFEDATAKQQHDLAAGFFTSLSVSILGIGGVVLKGALWTAGSIGEDNINLATATGCRALFLHSVDSSTYSAIFGTITFLGLATAIGTGSAWLVLNAVFKPFFDLNPNVAFNCVITQFIRSAPTTIDCDASASFAEANGASLNPVFEWNFDDGVGFQNMSSIVNGYNITKPGNYTVQLRITDTNGQSNTGYFVLEVPNPDPSLNCTNSSSH